MLDPTDDDLGKMVRKAVYEIIVQSSAAACNALRTVGQLLNEGQTVADITAALRRSCASRCADPALADWLALAVQHMAETGARLEL